MQLAEESVPMINPEGEQHGGEGGLLFLSAAEAVERALKSRPAKILLVTDGSSAERLRPFGGRVISLVLDERDALPLFSMPDGVSCVVAVGNRETLWAARYFAGVRDVPCALMPSSLAMEGVFESEAKIVVGGTEALLPLTDGEALCDLRLAAPSAPRAFSKLLLSRLALTEGRALRAFHVRVGREEAEEEAYGLLSPVKGALGLKELATINARMRRCERDGAYAGEGVCLAAHMAENGAQMPEWRAYVQLCALYGAFFARGKVRLCFVPDYAERASRAGAAYPVQSIPSPSEFARRAVTLEKVRSAFLRELDLIERGRAGYEAALRFYGVEETGAGKTDALFALPEYGGGLSALIRDFGLLEGK